MSKLNPEKLSVEFREGVTNSEPIIPRRYTLTHSDITAELFLTIGLEYAYDKITAMRDEVLGEWIKKEEGYFYHVYLNVDGESGSEATAIRDFIFRRELPLALEAIRYGDSEFFSAHTELDSSPIIVFFRSNNPEFNKVENWGTFSDYVFTSSSKASMANTFRQDLFLLDMKVGDVTGDGIPDKVFLYGYKPQGTTGIFVNNITVVIEDGRTNKIENITPQFNSGYNARLFLGDFTKDKTDDIKVSIQSGGNGGSCYFYIYSFKNNNLQEIFNFDMYNKDYIFSVYYNVLYKVDVVNIKLDKLFVIDISYKGYGYLFPIYYDNGNLKRSVQGEVLTLSRLIPIVKDEKNNAYDLLAFQRIIGTSNSDTLGYIENLLSWDGQKFVSTRILASIPGTNLISLY
jgi:hypothetical protein